MLSVVHDDLDVQTPHAIRIVRDPEPIREEDERDCLPLAGPDPSDWAAYCDTLRTELPLADWRVHAAAFELCRKSGHRDLAERHLALSRQRIIKLADSLPAEEPLQRIFLSAPLVRKTLGDSEPPKLRVQNA